MEDTIGLLLVSHGNFAKAAIESAELIVGKQENYATLGIEVVDDVDVIKKSMFDKVEALTTSQGLIVLTDIIGGTPMNLASHLLENEKTVIISGLNLPLLLEILMNRQTNIESVMAGLNETYKQGFSIRTYADMKEGEDDEYSL